MAATTGARWSYQPVRSCHSRRPNVFALSCYQKLSNDCWNVLCYKQFPCAVCKFQVLNLLTEHQGGGVEGSDTWQQSASFWLWLGNSWSHTRLSAIANLKFPNQKSAKPPGCLSAKFVCIIHQNINNMLHSCTLLKSTINVYNFLTILYAIM